MVNQIQFQKGLSLKQFMQQYGSEAPCEELCKQARWPQGYCCPRCHHTQASTFRRNAQPYWQCSRCGYQSACEQEHCWSTAICH